MQAQAGTQARPVPRPYPPPRSAWVMAQRWHHLLFAHWALPPDVVRKALPAALPLDTFEGKAWLSIVPFGVTRARPRWLPPVPILSRFPQVNVRTYVTLDGKPGVYFFSLYVNNPLAVFGARLVFKARFTLAQMAMDMNGDKTRLTSRQERAEQPSAALEARYHPTGEGRYAEPGSIDYWLAERYCLYSLDTRQRVYRTELHHDAWLLHPAQVELPFNTLALPLGIELPAAPTRASYAKQQDAVMWLPHRV